MEKSADSVRPTKGERDHSKELVKMVLMDHETYVIYVTEECGLRWWAADPAVAQRLGPITDLKAKVSALQTGALIHHQSLNKQTALALHKAFEGETDRAREILQTVAERLCRMRTAIGRLHFLLSALGAVGLFGVAAVGAYLFDWQADGARLVLWVCFFGSLGAFLSVALRVTGLSIDPDDPSMMTISLAASRVIIGVIGAVFTYVLVEADALLGFVSSDGPHGLLAVSLLAGFSETLVPNILERMDREIDGEEGGGSEVIE